MSYLFADQYKARDYFNLLKRAVDGKNYFCVRFDSGCDYPFTADSVIIGENDVLVHVEKNDKHVEHVYFEDLDTLSFEFIPGYFGKPGYFKPIRKEKPVPTLNPTEFQDYYIKETFGRLKEVVVLNHENFWTVLGMQTNLAKPGHYELYLKRTNGSYIQKIAINPQQTFKYYKNSDSWLIDPEETVLTDIRDIKQELGDGVNHKVVVSGKTKTLHCMSEISANLLHFIFLNEDQEPEHFYSTKGIRLRVINGVNGTEYRLDHIRRMTID